MTALIQRFLNGTCFNAYEYFGAHATVRGGKQGTVFRVYAPRAQRVELICNFNGWAPVEMHQIDPCGVYELFEPAAQPGNLYKYRIYNDQINETVRDRCDPFGRQSELRPGTASIIPSAGRYEFADSKWRKAKGNHYNQPINIYEVHAGSWRQHPDGSWYTYRELAETLVPYCKAHFYTHVEFLPLAEHPFDGSWGYQCGGYFSITARYGAPEDFLYLVDCFHRAGIGVIMDFVPVHFIPDEYALARFDGLPLYEYDDYTGLRVSEWGSCNFDFGKGITRSFVQSAADFWLNYCHCDGLRFDAIRNLIYWQGDESRGQNSDAIEFLRGCNAGLKKRHPNALLIAEDSTNLIKVTAPVEYDGLGFDYKWDLGWMNDTLSYFALPPARRAQAHHRLTFSMSYFYDNLFLLPLSHDEVVHGKKTLVDKMWGDYDQKFAQCRVLFTYFYTHPGKKLTFMGNELGQFREWDESRELDWPLLTYPMHDGFCRFLTGISGLYFSSAALHDDEYNMKSFRWLVADDAVHSVYVYERCAGGDRLVCVFNLSDRLYEAYPIPFSEPVTLREMVNSDTAHYGGSGVTNDWAVYSAEEEGSQVARIRLAPFSACVFRVME